MHFTRLDRRIWLKGLTLECPIGDSIDDCPLNSLRPLPVVQLNGTINGLSDDQVDAVVSIHRHCYHNRVKELRR